MILPINHLAGWRYIRQRNQTQINIDLTRENTTRIDHNYIVVDKVITKNRPAYKLKNPSRGPYEIVQTCTNGTFTLQTGAFKHRINIRNIKLYNDADVE